MQEGETLFRCILERAANGRRERTVVEVWADSLRRAGQGQEGWTVIGLNPDFTRSASSCRFRLAMTNGKRVPDFYKCANPECDRKLEVRKYLGRPSSDFPEEKIHRIWQPHRPEFSMQCTCGHYTVVSPREPEEAHDEGPTDAN